MRVRALPAELFLMSQVKRIFGRRAEGPSVFLESLPGKRALFDICERSSAN